MRRYESDEFEAQLRAQLDGESEFDDRDFEDDLDGSDDDFGDDGADDEWFFHLLGASLGGPFADYDEHGAPRLEVARLARAQDASGRMTWRTASDCTTFCSHDATRGDLLDSLGPGRYRVRVRLADGTFKRPRDIVVGDLTRRKVGSARDDREGSAPASVDQRIAWYEQQLARATAERDDHARRLREDHKAELERLRREHDDRVVRLQGELADAGRRRAKLEEKLADAQEAREDAQREKRDLEIKLLRAEVTAPASGGGNVVDNLKGQIGQLQDLQELLGSLQQQAPTASGREQMMEKIGQSQQLIGQLVMMAKTLG